MTRANSSGWSKIALVAAIAGAVFISGRPAPSPLFAIGAVLMVYGVFAAIRSRRPGAPLLGIPAMSYLALATIAGVAFLHIAAMAAGAGAGRGIAAILGAIVGDPSPPPPSTFEYFISLLGDFLALLTCGCLLAAGLVPSTPLWTPRFPQK